MKRLKKLSEETVHENPWWKYKHDTLERMSGEMGDYYYAETNGAVMIVPRLPDGRIAMVLQYRYLSDKQSIEFPGGGIEIGVEVEQAARIELHEETGWVADEVVKIGVFEPANGFVKDLTHVFLAEVTEQGKQELDFTEDIEVLYRRPDEIREMVQRNEIWDGQTLAAWALVEQHLVRER